MIQILFRLDAGLNTGFGHLSRNLVLAEALHDFSVHSTFLIKTENKKVVQDFLNNRDIYSANVEFLPEQITLEQDLNKTVEAYNRGFKFLIIDHYQADTPYQVGLKRNKVKWGQFDYKVSEKILADLIINYNISVTFEDYLKDYIPNKEARLCVGFNYAFIRSDLFGESGNVRHNNVLVSLGGGRLKKDHLRMIKEVSLRNKEYVFNCIVTNINKDELKGFSSKNINFYINPSNLASIFKSCEYAISAGGTTAFELAFLQTPMLLIPIADNQIFNVKAWDKLSFGISFNDANHFMEVINKKGVGELFERAKEVVEAKKVKIDGKGAYRTAKAIMELI